MVGFVLIMVLVAVIFLVFLGLFIRKGPSDSADNEELAQFLDAIVEYTTDCSIVSGSAPKKLEDLIIAAYNDENCQTPDFPSIPAKEVLDYTIGNLTESSWNFGESSPEVGYRLHIYEPSPGNSQTYFLRKFSGTTASNIRKAEKVISVPEGEIIISLQIFIGS